tara:strand:- start:706 stop:948 length:243 start_codon:yes stop_codon:yes gene_type:complete
MSKLLTKSDLAEMFSVKEATIVKWVKSGMLPTASVDINQKARYWTIEDIQSWISDKGEPNESATSVSDTTVEHELSESQP